jgi:flagellin
MAFSVNTNIASLQAQNYLRVNSEFQSKTINRVTSGLRIISSGDDAAGLAIANGLRSDQSVLTQGIRNANDGLSTLQTIDGGMNNISQLLDRARTLATQSASGTFTGSRGVLNSEFQSVLTEIDRQAQAIGLNQNGEFAKALSVFIGGGRGSSSGAINANGSVSVDLSSSTVDTTSLGLDSIRATKTGYSLASTSATSVTRILTNSANTLTEAVTGHTTFTFKGAGFTDANAVKIDVNVAAVKDTDSLVKAVNDAIQTAANTTGAQYTAFKNAGVVATIQTDGDGKEQLAFSAPNAAFQVSANDRVANALMGNFEDPSTALGAAPNSYITGTYTAASITNTVLSLDFAGESGAETVATVALAATATITAAVGAINTALAGSTNYQGVKAYETADGKIQLSSNDGKSFTVMATGGTNVNALAAGFSATAVASSVNGSTVDGGGANVSKQSNDSAAFNYVNLAAAGTQTITFSGTHADGTQYSQDVTLTNASAAVTIDAAIVSINAQLQATGDPSLSKVLAVKDADKSGAWGIRFMSSEAFSVKLGAGTSGNGLKDNSTGAAVAQGAVIGSEVSAGSGMADISNQNSAKTVVQSLSSAVAALGQAQAVVGKGQNNFNFAVSLAQSQVTNLAAAESRIRDADLAQEAANLTKASILIQAGTAALAQANSAPQAILALLRG